MHRFQLEYWTHFGPRSQRLEEYCGRLLRSGMMMMMTEHKIFERLQSIAASEVELKDGILYTCTTDFCQCQKYNLENLYFHHCNTKQLLLIIFSFPSEWSCHVESSLTSSFLLWYVSLNHKTVIRTFCHKHRPGNLLPSIPSGMIWHIIFIFIHDIVNGTFKFFLACLS